MSGFLHRAADGRTHTTCGVARVLRVIVTLRAGLMVCVGALAASVACMAGTPEALGATGHAFVSRLSEAPVGAGLVRPGAVAVERSSGEVFVGDRGSGYVDVYSASGEYETQFGEGFIDPAGIAVDESNGDVYVAEPVEGAVLVYEPEGAGGYRLLARWSGLGTPGKEFGVLSGVAVDDSSGPSAGNVYVVESSAVDVQGGAVDVFHPKPNPPEGEGEEGVYVRRLSGGKLEGPNGVAVSPVSGRVLVADSAVGAIYAYGPEGSYEEKLTGKSSPYGSFVKGAPVGDVAGVGAGESSGDFYVAEAERHVVSQYGPSGEWEGWITSTPSGSLGEPSGVALNASGEVSVADAGLGLVDRYATGSVVPSVETGKIAKSAVTRTSAVLPGSIDGEGEPCAYRFQYGETEALGSETSVQAAGTTLQSVSATVGGLQAGRAYFYRIVGEDAGGASYGLVRELQTPAAVEALMSGPVDSVQPEAVMLTGSLKREGLQTHYYFQYGTSEAYGQQIPEPPGLVAPAPLEKEEKEARTLEASVTGLTANTLYHYRLVAENQYGKTYGQDRTFTTSGPPRITYEPTGGVGQSEATIHAKVDPDQFATTYRFEYGETTAYGDEAPEGGAAIGSGLSPVAVSAALSGLKVGRAYHFRVVAENSAGTTIGADQTLSTVSSATVDGTYATGLGSGEATLHASIDPLGNDTRFYFQYGTQSCQVNPSACMDSPEPPGQDIGAGSEGVASEVKLTGLTAGTTYHYHVLASNSLGVSEGPERTFTTPEKEEGSSFALADKRAWELVTPVDKGAAPVEALTREGGLILASGDGDALTYLVGNALGETVEGNRSPSWQQVLATRGVSSWTSQDIATPSSRAKGARAGHVPEYQFFDTSLSSALVEPVTRGSEAEPPLVPGVKQATIYLRDDATGAFSALVSEANTPAGTQFGGVVRFVSATPDLTHVVIDSGVALTGKGSAAGLYEWSGGVLRFVSVLPNGAPASPVKLGFYNVVAHAISSDGSRILFTKNEESTDAGHLYLRDVVKGQTVKLDAAQGLPEPPKGSAQFQWSSSDGSRVLFTDKRRLTADSTAEPTEPSSADLYECVIVEERGRIKCDLKDLTVDPGAHAGVQYFIFGASEDGSSVYLVAHGVFASNQNGHGETARADQDNLYELHDEGDGWSRTFVATLSGEDSQEWEGAHEADSAYLTARVSPNGRYLAFMSSVPLTGYDNVDANPEAKGARDEEVFLYDSATASLRCVSCDPSGARPEGVLDAEESGEGVGLLVDRIGVWLGHRLAGSIPGWTAQSLSGALFQSRYLSDEGRLFFNSPEDLVPAAQNRKEDVYEYEPAGVGSCQSPTGGCVSLISGGASDRESAFIEATPDASNVFFLTDSKLLPQDTDTAYDIYDARECTVLSGCFSPPAAEEAPCAETEACRPAEPAQPIPGVTWATATIGASGNIVSQPPPRPAKQGVQARKASRPLTRAQKLTRALRGCRKRYAHSKHRRERCERSARKRYAAKHTSNKRAKPNARKPSSKGKGR
jgi:phosphodiesterase/alkaline phosphatase D-like protein